MRFTVLKAAFGEVTGGHLSFPNIEGALKEIIYFKGWESKEQLHNAIKRWACHSDPGSVFTTQAAAIVAQPDGIAIDDNICAECGHAGIEYAEMSPVEGGNIEQKGFCPECGKQWNDVFVLVQRQELVRKSKKFLAALKAAQNSRKHF